jgi:hypothetical protein
MSNLKPDEYWVVAVPTTGYWAGIWRDYGMYRTRSEAYEAAELLDRSRYKACGVQPRVSWMAPFYTHPLTVVWE